MSTSSASSSAPVMSNTIVEQRVPRSNLRNRIVASSVGSVLTSLAVTPLEVVKVRRQAAAAVEPQLPRGVTPCPRGCGTFVLSNGLLDCVLPKTAVSFFDPASGKLTPQASMLSENSGTFGMLRRILMQEGLPGVYAGLRPTLVMAVPNTVVYFTAYEDLVWRLRGQVFTDSSSAAPLVAGGTARLLASSLTAPFELIRTRQAVAVGMNAGKSRPSLLSEFRTLVAQDGVGALYRGLAPTLWRDVPFSALYWLSLEHLRTLWKSRSVAEPSSSSWQQQTGQEFVNGATAGTLAATMTTPFDVVKTRQQVGTLNSVTTASASGPPLPPPPATAVRCHHNGAAVYKAPTPATTSSRTVTSTALSANSSTLKTLQHIARTEGVGGLWRGNQTRLFKVAPSCAIMISSYELGKRLLQEQE